MMTEIANSVNYFHIEFECSGSGGGCADADAKRRSVKAAFPNLIIRRPAKDSFIVLPSPTLARVITRSSVSVAFSLPPPKQGSFSMTRT